MKIKPVHRCLLYCLAILVLGGFLPGCVPLISEEFDLSISLSEKWVFETTITPSPGYEDAVLEQLNSFASNGEAQAMGIETKVTTKDARPDGSVPIKLSMTGQGYESLNQALGEETITVDDSNGQRTLRFNSNLNQQYMAQSTTFTLRGGTIVEHNGTLVDDKTVMWNNYPGTMQAVMIEPSIWDYWLYIAIGGIAVMGSMVIALLVLAFTKPKARKKKTVIHQPIQARKLCWQCGSTIPAQAVFCPACGTKQS